MCARSIWPWKHEHYKGAITHNLVRDMNLFFMQLLADFSTQKKPNARGESESRSNILLLNLTTFWCFWMHFLFHRFSFLPFRFTFQPLVHFQENSVVKLSELKQNKNYSIVFLILFLDFLSRPCSTPKDPFGYADPHLRTTSVQP